MKWDTFIKKKSMKISELIEILQDRLSQAGDQDVVVYDTDYEQVYPLEVEYSKWEVVFKPE